MNTNNLFFLILLFLILFIMFRFILADYNSMKSSNLVIVRNTISISNLNNKTRILRSQDKKGGLEYTYSFWLFINGSLLRDGEKYNVFLKGSENDCTEGEISSIQSPGVWVEKSSNQAKLLIYTNLYLPDDCPDNDSIEKCPDYCEWNTDSKECKNKTEGETAGISGLEIDNVPIDKWVHFTVIAINRRMDVYLNGELYNQKLFPGLLKQNENNLTIGACNPLQGQISDLRYFNSAISSYEIDKLVKKEIGPLETSANLGRNNQYLSKKFWVQDSYKQ